MKYITLPPHMTQKNECTPIPGQLEQLTKPDKPKCCPKKKWCGLTWCSFLNWLVLLGLTGLVFFLWFWMLTTPTVVHEHITQDVHKHITEQHDHHTHVQEHKHVTEVHEHPTTIVKEIHEHPMEPHTHKLPEHDHPLKPHTHPDLECRIRRLERMAHTHRYCR